MFGLLENLLKATVAVVVTPVALVADIVSIPFDSSSNTEVFSRTSGLLDDAGKALKEAVKS